MVAPEIGSVFSGYNFDDKKIKLVYKKYDIMMKLSRILYRTDT